MNFNNYQACMKPLGWSMSSHPCLQTLSWFGWLIQRCVQKSTNSPKLPFQQSPVIWFGFLQIIFNIIIKTRPCGRKLWENEEIKTLLDNLEFGIECLKFSDSSKNQRMISNWYSCTLWESQRSIFCWNKLYWNPIQRICRRAGELDNDNDSPLCYRSINVQRICGCTWIKNPRIIKNISNKIDSAKHHHSLFIQNNHRAILSTWLRIFK